MSKLILVTFNRLSGTTGVSAFTRHLLSQLPGTPLVHLRLSHRSKLNEAIGFNSFPNVVIDDLDPDDFYLFLDTPGKSRVEFGVYAATRLPRSTIIIHDPTTIEGPRGSILEKVRQKICIRRACLKIVPDAIFVRHPYTPIFTDAEALEDNPRGLALAHSRIDFSKQTHVILQANKILPDDKKIVVVGRQNRAYAYFKLKKIETNWSYDTEYPDVGGAYQCRQFIYDVDLTRFDQDGGGTQYTFLEAADAGAIPVLWHEWLRHDTDITADNCFIVDSAESLAKLMIDHEERNLKIAQFNRELLKRHNTGWQIASIATSLR